jgi:hypothetical protein
MPKDLVDAIDGMVGRRGRSKFLTEAAEKEIRRLRLRKAAEKAGGSLRHVNIAGWETDESASEWVRASRRGDEEKARRGLRDA